MKALYALLITGLSATIATAQAPRVRDSAGVRIVENPSRFQAPIAFALGDKPTFHFGGLQSDPADEFDARNGYMEVASLSDGRILVADKTRVLIFDRPGRRVSAFGRAGQGPGEANQIFDVCVARGDTILVGQARSLPVSRFSKDGKFLSSIGIGGIGYTERNFCFADGSVRTVRLVQGKIYEPEIYEYTRVRADGSTNLIARAEYPAFDPLIYVPIGNIAWGDRLFFATAMNHQFLAYDPDGRLRMIVRTDDQLKPISSADRDRLPLTTYPARATDAEKEALRQRAVANSKTKYFPTFSRMQLDESGRIWMEDWRPADQRDSAQTWTAFAPDGRIIGRLTIPGTPRASWRMLIGFGRDEVFFRSADDDGAMHLTAYPILSVKR